MVETAWKLGDWVTLRDALSKLDKPTEQNMKVYQVRTQPL